MFRKKLARAVALAGLLASSSIAEAVTFTGSSSDGSLSASAQFTIIGAAGARQLEILLTNTDAATGLGAPTASNQVLSGVFFNLGTSAFSPVSARLRDAGGSTIGTIVQTGECDITACAGKTNVGGEWGYQYYSGGNWLGNVTHGISSSGYLGGGGDFGNSNQNPNYAGPPSGALNGIDFGLVPTGWSTTPNGGLANDPLIAGTVRFVLNVPDGLTEDQITNVYFTYGTDQSEPNFQGTTSGGGTSGGGTSGGVPEPASLGLFGVALAALSYRLRTRSR